MSQDHVVDLVPVHQIFMINIYVYVEDLDHLNLLKEKIIGSRYTNDIHFHDQQDLVARVE